MKKPLVLARVAHLYSKSIHPFEDGNGRIGGVLSEKSLSQGIGRPVFLSLSRTIEAHQKQYDAALQIGQQDNEITDWVSWFVNMAHEAQIQAEEQVEFTLRKTKIFDRLKDAMNPNFAFARFPFVSSVPRHHQSCSYSWEESHEGMPPTVRPTAAQVKSSVLTGHRSAIRRRPWP